MEIVLMMQTYYNIKNREMKRDGELMKEAPVFHHLFKRNLFLILSTFFCYYYYGTFSCAFFK